MASLDYTLLEDRPAGRSSFLASPLRLATGLLGLGAFGVGWVSRWTTERAARVASAWSRPPPDEWSEHPTTLSPWPDAFAPRRGKSAVLVKPGAPGALQILPIPAPAEGAGLCIFYYGDNLAQMQQEPAFFAGAQVEEGWLYGATTAGHKLLAIPTGKADDIVKGRSACWSATTLYSAKLSQTDRVLNFNANDPNRGELRRDRAHIVKQDGTDRTAQWYYQVGAGVGVGGKQQPQNLVAGLPPEKPGKALIFGCGYSGSYFARSLVKDGWTVIGTRTEVDDFSEDEELYGAREMVQGVELVRFEEDCPVPSAVFKGVTHILISIPPDDAVPAGQALNDVVLRTHAKDLAALDSLQWLGVLSTSGVYGDHGGALVTEDSATVPTSNRTIRRLAAEKSWLQWGAESKKPVQLFRLSGIYGPGPFRSTIYRLQNPGTGPIQRVHKPGHLTGRIHVFDMVTVLRAAMRVPHAGPIFNVCDDEPAHASETIGEAARILGVEEPPEILFDDVYKSLSPMALSFYADDRKVSNQRIKEILGVKLRYPTYREGFRGIVNGDSLFSDGAPVPATAKPTASSAGSAGATRVVDNAFGEI